MIKTLKKTGIEGMYLNILKTIYDKPMANIVLGREKMKPFPLKSEMSTLSIFIQYSAQILSQRIKAKENKRDKNKKGRSQIFPILKTLQTLFCCTSLKSYTQSDIIHQSG
jgi:hypothetical protein